VLDRAKHLQSIQNDREDLASAIRLAAHFDLHEGICNHFSVQCEGPDELYLINAYGWHWSEVTADRLLLIDGDGNVVDGQGEVEASAHNIHIASHRANPRHKAILHVHMPYATAISMLEGGRLLMAHQTAARFHGRIGYEEEFGGIAVTQEEGERIAKQAKDNSQIDCMFLANHGAVCSGPSVAQAFDDLYYLERAARQQVLAQSTGLPLKLIPQDVVELTAAQFQRDFKVYAGKHFEALKRLV
jgi:ribulose-5-phosphate 4-epimerase/fuculose-1-phosphate aldolase